MAKKKIKVALKRDFAIGLFFVLLSLLANLAASFLWNIAELNKMTPIQKFGGIASLLLVLILGFFGTNYYNKHYTAG